MTPVKSPSLVGRDRQMDASFTSQVIRSDDFFSMVFSKENTISSESSLRIHLWVMHKWLNIWKWVIPLLISTNQRWTVNWGHLHKIKKNIKTQYIFSSYSRTPEINATKFPTKKSGLKIVNYGQFPKNFENKIGNFSKSEERFFPFINYFRRLEWFTDCEFWKSAHGSPVFSTKWINPAPVSQIDRKIESRLTSFIEFEVEQQGDQCSTFFKLKSRIVIDFSGTENKFP